MTDTLRQDDATTPATAAPPRTDTPTPARTDAAAPARLLSRAGGGELERAVRVVLDGLAAGTARRG
ncbi:hypothetical protein AB0H64_28300, partial [Nonomuraea sp. NPDC050733]|uniref:hypothetical protein n=1 Tax=Nonomuraea sp. NPDC050733 TaxID=3154633 RepID=UPI0033EE9943